MITPLNDTKHGIVFCVDDNYVKYLYVVIKSLVLTSNINTNYDIIIFHSCKDIDNLLKISELETSNISIRYLDVSSYTSGNNYFISGYITIATYYRIFIPQLLSKYNRILYLDTDIIIREDINNLLNYDLDEYMIGSIPDFSGICRSFGRLFIPRTYDDEYFCSGVLLMDIPKLNKFDFVNKCIDLINKYGNTVRGHDNDIICQVCFRNVKRIDANWMCITNLLEKRRPTKNFFLIRLPYLFGDEVEDFWSNPKLIHYEGHGPYKPWNNRNSDWLIHTGCWWKVAEQTPYYEEFCKDLENYVWPDKVIDYINVGNYRKKPK